MCMLHALPGRDYIVHKIGILNVNILMPDFCFCIAVEFFLPFGKTTSEGPRRGCKSRDALRPQRHCMDALSLWKPAQALIIGGENCYVM